MWGGEGEHSFVAGATKTNLFFFLFFAPADKDRQIKKEASGNKKNGPLNSFPLFPPRCRELEIISGYKIVLLFWTRRSIVV